MGKAVMRSYLLLVFSFVGYASAQVELQTTMGDIALTINNVGIYGNAFKGSYQVSNFKSCEYPRNSGVEHLFEAGIWVGGLRNGEVRVSTTSMDNSRGYTLGSRDFEFTAPQNAFLKERSSLFNNRVYDPKSISHQDFISDYTDNNLVVPGTQIQIPDHQPLQLDVHLETYNWNYSFANAFVILNYTFTNAGVDPIDSLFIGMFANAVVRNTNITPAGSGGTAFYNKGGNGYNDSLYMGYCFDVNGDPGFTDSYFAHKFLGAETKDGFLSPDIDSLFKSHYNAWMWNQSGDPFLFSPTDDLTRYKKMTGGLNHKEEWQSKFVPQLVGPGNRSDLVSVGPFARLAPGDKIQIAFAIVCGKKFDDGNPTAQNTAAQQQNLIENAQWAQTAYFGEDVNKNGVLDPGEDRDGNGEITRFILPSPPDIPDVKYVPGDGVLDIYWTTNAEASVDPITQKKDFAGYKLYLSQLGFDTEENIDLTKSLKPVAIWDVAGDSIFYETGFSDILSSDPAAPGDGINYSYHYRLKGLVNGWQYAVSLTSFDTGDEETKLESLESSPIAGVYRVFMGTPPVEEMKNDAPFAYPNPYYLEAAWEGSSTRQTTRRMIFANLPAQCVIRIYTMAGDLVRTIEHDTDYNGDDIAWFEAYSDVSTAVMPGGEHSWDLLSDDGQTVARGIYLFSVKDLQTNKLHKGKFTLIR
jgi:hypothetical protein